MTELIGVDEVTFSVSRTELPANFVFKNERFCSPLKSKAEFVRLFQRDGKVFVAINLPRFLRKTNRMPFRLSETRACGELVSSVLSFLSGHGLQDATVTTAETNLTLNIERFSTTKDILELLAFCFDRGAYGKTFAAYDSEKKIGFSTHTKKLESVRTQKSSDGSHILKVYDKNAETGIIDGRELLRVEMILQQRELFRMFDDRTIGGIICDDGIQKLVSFFCTTWLEYTEPRIEKYRLGVQNELERQLFIAAERCARGFAVEAFAFITGYFFLDTDILKRGISNFCRKSGRRTAQAAIYKNLVERFDFIPTGIDETLSVIHKICKEYAAENELVV